METKSLTDTLIEKWNKQEIKQYGINEGELHYPDRWELKCDLSSLRKSEINNWSDSSYYYHSETLNEDKEKLKAYRSLFVWDEKYSVEASFNVETEDYLYTNIECEDLNEALEYINDTDKEIDEPDTYDYEGGLYIEGEQDRKIIIKIDNLILRDENNKIALKAIEDMNKKEKVQVILEIEKVEVEGEEEPKYGEGECFVSVAEDVKELINSKVPYLKVVNAIQEEVIIKGK